MKFSHINIKNALALIPAWAINPIQLMRDLDRLLTEYINKTGLTITWDRSLQFSCELVLDNGQYKFSIIDQTNNKPWPNSEKGMLIIEARSILGGDCIINIPINPLLKKHDSIEDQYLVYQHSIFTETPLSYIGVTRKKWFDRLAQHLNDSKNGSPYLFHDAIRKHSTVRKGHTVILAGIDKHSAMELEEEFVGVSTLYPLGLNMIPGGYTGIRYLGKLGIQTRTPSERDAAIERLCARESLNGIANPLCAARWASDQDYVNRVICGHSGRLTVDQVRTIRLLNYFGMTREQISDRTGSSIQKVTHVLARTRYGRIQ